MSSPEQRGNSGRDSATCEPAHAGLAPLRAHLLAIQRLREVQGTSKSPPEPPLAALRTGVARWYNEAMERLTCQYKRKASKALFWTGLALALCVWRSAVEWK
ncbi:MAG: hypothetical protein KJ072_06550 [Verrucomicrobia bacterium]|nr:hypothetical protein [Verrucomicrobiota bacterium]